MKRFSALNRMMAFSMGSVPVLAGSRRTQGRDGGLEARFRVDEEVGRGHDAIAGGEAGRHRVRVPLLDAESDRARLEAPVPVVEEDDLAVSGVDHGALG